MHMSERWACRTIATCYPRSYSTCTVKIWPWRKEAEKCNWAVTKNCLKVPVTSGLLRGSAPVGHGSPVWRVAKCHSQGDGNVGSGGGCLSLLFIDSWKECACGGWCPRSMDPWPEEIFQKSCRIFFFFFSSLHSLWALLNHYYLVYVWLCTLYHLTGFCTSSAIFVCQLCNKTPKALFPCYVLKKKCCFSWASSSNLMQA